MKEPVMPKSKQSPTTVDFQNYEGRIHMLGSTRDGGNNGFTANLQPFTARLDFLPGLSRSNGPTLFDEKKNTVYPMFPSDLADLLAAGLVYQDIDRKANYIEGTFAVTKKNTAIGIRMMIQD